MDLPAQFRCDHALLPTGWADDVVIDVGTDGCLVAVSAGTPGTGLPSIGRWLVPGMPNLHSHAFQRAMAGMAEQGHGGHDDFWSWREAMYAVASRLSPESLRAIAAHLYMELLCAGYTAVCEFHYVHHRPDGRPYEPASAMSDALCEASREAGIGLTLLPTLYQVGGFDARPLASRQARFGHHVDAFLRLLSDLRASEDADLRLGVAIHSLRAVPRDSMLALLESGLPDAGPIHIHVAEQLGEVDDCLRERGARPVDWLLDHAPVDPRWCVVHATHLSASERARLARTGAVAGLCPTTEANLGDGLFALPEWLSLGGAFGIGSDSHVCVSAAEELRWLEYGQRLRLLRRNVAAPKEGGSTALALWLGACVGGAQATGRAVGAIAPGCRADLVVLDHDAPMFEGRGADRALDALVFGGGPNGVRDVYVGGKRVVERGHHRDAARITTRWRAAMREFV